MATKSSTALPLDQSPVTETVTMQRAPAIEPTTKPMDDLIAIADRVPVDVLERLIAMRDRERAQAAKTAYGLAMNKAQKQMRPIAADAWNPQTRSRYASYEALDAALRPIYTSHGFSLSFNTGDSPLTDHVRVLCEVTHEDGHSREHHIDMPADGKGAKGGDVMTKTHAVGSAMTYGQRYLLKMIFNVAVGESDDDGNAAGDTTPRKEAPDGYAKWLEELSRLAAKGGGAFFPFWNKSDERYRQHLTNTDRGLWAKLKAEAAAAGKGGAS